MVRQYRFLEREGVLQLRTDRQKFLPWGLEGGKPGSPSSNVVTIDGVREVPPSKAARILHRGDVLRHTLAGAGGYGDPLARDPVLVAEDVADEKVSVEAARAEYGVVIDPITFAVDAEATAALRASLA
jgi:N-methylhydantoinase B